MINRSEIEAAAAEFGVPDTQIIRDHLISHVIAAVGEWPDRDCITFFGGTALCRTWLPHLRLSEDIDLLVDSTADGERLRRQVSERLRREFPNREWTRVGAQHQVETWTLAVNDLEVKVQFVEWRSRWKLIPRVMAPIQLRYSDLAISVDLQVPTPSGFAAMKLLAWFDRRTPRDLYDLAAMAGANHIDQAAVDLVKHIAGFTPSVSSLERRVPSIVESAWEVELGHQLADSSTAEECLAEVRSALARIDSGEQRSRS